MSAPLQFPTRAPLKAENIPADLRAVPNWLRFKWTAPDPKGKRSKVPWHATRNEAGSSTNPATWATFEEALGHVGRDGTSGLGFAFTRDAGFVGIDLDGVFDDTGALAPETWELVRRLGTYTERSISGRGLHLIGRAALSRAFVDHARGIEVYGDGRYFTVTGDILEDFATTVRDISRPLAELLAEANAKPDAPRSEPTGDGRSRHDALRETAWRLAGEGYSEARVIAALKGERDHFHPKDGRAIDDGELVKLARSACEKNSPGEALTVAQIIGEPEDHTGWYDEPGTDWLVEGFLPRAGYTAISAGAGVSKSLLSEYLLCLLAAGRSGHFLGAYPLPGVPLRCVVIERENGAARWRRRLRELVMGGALTRAEADTAVQNLLCFHSRNIAHPELVIGSLDLIHAELHGDVYYLDPLRSFMPRDVADENDNLAVGRVVDELVAFTQRNGVALLLNDHDSKGGVAARGASTKSDAVEHLFHLEKKDADDQDYFELDRLKGRDPSETPRVVAFLRRRGGAVTDEAGRKLHPVAFEPCERRVANEKRSDVGERRDRVLCAVQDHYERTRTGASVAMIEKALSIPHTTAQRDLNDLVARGLLYRPDERSSVYPLNARVKP